MADDEIIVDDESTEEEEDAFAEPQKDKTEDEKSKNKEDDDDDEPKSRRSEIAQKKHWREKAKSASSKVQELQAELDRLKSAVKKPDDEKEAAAQEYIRNQARKVFEELQLEKSKEEATELADFEEKVETILEDNPDVAEEELLDTIEEYEVEPHVALKIIQKQATKEKVKKPKMPQAKQASPSGDDKKPDDSKKSIWQIAQDEIKKIKS